MAHFMGAGMAVLQLSQAAAQQTLLLALASDLSSANFGHKQRASQPA